VNLKTAVTPSDDHHFSVMQRIMDGRLSIDSPEEFLDIIKIYKEDPFLHRKYADLLNDLKRFDGAAESYATAAKLFIENKMNLQAVVAKILQWSIQKPSHLQGRSFYAHLREEGGRQNPLQRFWARMNYAELVAFMRRLVRIRLDAGVSVTRVDEPAEHLYFIVSGTVCEMPSVECAREAESAGFEIEPVLLGPNDLFGDVFPLDLPTLTSSELRTVTQVELVKINKSVLRSVCDRHPHIGILLQEIGKPEHRENCDRSWQWVRRAMRYGLPTRVEIDCPATKNSQKDLHYTGIATDLSMGGMCLEIADIAPADLKKSLKGRIARFQLDLLNDVVLLNVSGKIVWQRRFRPKDDVLLIGIRFDTLSKMDRALLAEYCSGSVGEQNLLWSLWETLVRTDNS
jgi:hypothetical protein